MKTMKLLGLIALLAAVVFAPLAAQEDAEGSKDHPLLTRMTGYFISTYSHKDFDSFEFRGKDGKAVTVEGKKTEIMYRPKDGVTAASPLQIARNYQTAVTKVGGAVLFQGVEPGGGLTTLRLVKDGDEVWTQVQVGDSGNNYTVTIVEKAGMKQEIIASADAWKTDIGSTGHAAVYGILFDSDKSEIKAGSEKALDEIAKLLKQNPKLELLVVGHTDSTGDIAHNMTLSEARAKSVVAVLTGKYGVAASRLSAYGVGPLAPVSTNDTDAGKVKNRRVELVKK